MADRYDLILRGGTLVSGTGLRPADVFVRHGRIVTVAEPGRAQGAAASQVVDVAGLHLLPGLIDGHVHFRQPGLEPKEDWLSGSRAAVMGGVTTVLEMPNTLPPTDSAERAAAKASIAGRTSHCDFGLFGLLGAHNGADVADLLTEPSVVGLKVFLGPSTGDLEPPDDDVLRAGLRLAARAGVRVAFHAEDAALVPQADSSGIVDGRSFLAARPVAAEVAAIDHAGRLLVETGATGHILHLSSADGLAAVERWRAQGVDLTCEASAHHCFLSAADYERLGGVMKCYPPVREADHGDALLAGLAAGRIDCIASDHAPHTPAEKLTADFEQVPGGIAGVETTLPLFLSRGWGDNRLGLERLVSAFAERPAQVWGLWPRKGAVAPGADADMVLVDLARRGAIRAADLRARHRLTPFDGWPTQGVVVGTVLRGKMVARQGELLAEPGWGRLVARSTRPA